MRVLSSRPDFPFSVVFSALFSVVVAVSFSGPVTAFATSVGRLSAPSTSACSVTARFVSARVSEKPRLNRKAYEVRWNFDPLVDPAPAGSRCSALSLPFEVFVPGGSYSTATKSTVYPLSIREPEPGAEIELRLERVVFPGGDPRWLIGDGAESYRVRR